MNRHMDFSVSMLTFMLVFLGISGLGGGLMLLTDPSGQTMGLDHIIDQIPGSNFLLPAIWLTVVFGIFPLLVAAELIFRRNGKHIFWAGSQWRKLGIFLGISLIIWIVIQMYLIGFEVRFHPLFGGLGVVILWLFAHQNTRKWLGV